MVALTKQLRKNLSADRTHLILEQIELRKRAVAKFRAAERMFFTRQLLEQATDERIAEYKAKRFAAGDRVADLCCGIGGDLLTLCHRGPCLAVDRDPVALLLAEVNCQYSGGEVQCEISDVQDVMETLDVAAWHIDPDRRSSGTRTSRVEFADPGRETLMCLIKRQDSGAIKLAPAAELDHELADEAELEWISSRRECRQQVAWLGKLAQQAGMHTATSIDRRGEATSFTGMPRAGCAIAKPSRYLFDPDPALVAARLVGAVANAFDLAAVSTGASYLTGESLVHHSLLTPFEIEEVLPLDTKRLRAMLRDKEIGRLEIKVRGVQVKPEELRIQIQSRGDQKATILVFQSEGSTCVALAHRLTRST
ncbi:MAG: hypothetical protein CMJ64_07655 [Planctomycetaceae bacterium]|nr:hypothetical protein [Planctomycetaceae bacterium]